MFDSETICSYPKPQAVPLSFYSKWWHHSQSLMYEESQKGSAKRAKQFLSSIPCTLNHSHIIYSICLGVLINSIFFAIHLNHLWLSFNHVSTFSTLGDHPHWQNISHCIKCVHESGPIPGAWHISVGKYPENWTIPPLNTALSHIPLEWINTILIDLCHWTWNC